MKLNWAERLVVNNPVRVWQQKLEIKWFQRIIAPAKETAFLEVGCGRGAGAKLILENFHPARLCTLDLDLKMILKARDYLQPQTQSQTALLVGDAIALPFENNSMDVVFGFGFLHHVPDWRAALAQIARVLKIGGIYYIEELYPGLYQNFLTRHILLHPRKDRFLSRDLKRVLHQQNLILKGTLEASRFGILGVAVKK